MENLKNILADLKITNDIELKRYVDSNYGEQKELPLKIVRSKDLRLDSENRIFDDKIEYKKTIFDIDKIKILNSVDISFQDCIFTGSLRVSNKDERIPTTIFLDTVIVKDELFVSGAFNISKCTISDVNCTELSILNNDNISELSVSGCNVGLMTIYNTKIKAFRAIFNRIDRFESSYSEFEKVSFSKDQINIKNHKLIFKKSKHESIRKKHRNFAFNKIDHEQLGKNEKLKIAKETSNFLLSNSDYHLNRGDQALLKYISGLASIPNPFKRLLYQVFGGLILPYRILFLMLTTIILFSLLYYFAGVRFSISNMESSLCFSEALYFSGISFTTIGYGDIAPLKFIRYIAVIEGAIGILLSSSFVVSLTRKYID